MALTRAREQLVMETEYDELLMSGWDRYDARQRIADQVDSVLSKWQETNVRHAQKENSEG